jgi:type VI secretion system protein ImpF
MKQRSDGYFQISLMNIFRQAARQKDAKDGFEESSDTQDRVLSSRMIERREGAADETLRSHLLQDLGSLFSTINLESVEPLTEFPYVQASIINYGILDLTSLTTADIKSQVLLKELRTSLLRHEPRLIDKSISVKLRSESEDSRQHVAFDISADMSAKPVDVPLEFVAEIDTGGGKMSLSSKGSRG